MRKAIPLLLTLISVCGADSRRLPVIPAENRKALNDYFRKNQAEISRFSLEQARYGEVHKGYEVMVFINEPFFTDTQVKNEGAWNNRTANVLKVNRVRRFVTGIYDYSLMTSVFTPISEKPSTLKVTFSAQDWCGQSFMQINRKENDYLIRLFSYFEKEGDAENRVADVLLEDEILNLIRLNPASLPKGEITLLPGSHILRLRHMPQKTMVATASLEPFAEKGFPGKDLMAYKLVYRDMKREIRFIFEKQAPHLIAGWQESHPSGWGPGEKILTSTAKRTHLVYGPYWSQHDLKNEGLRRSLGL